MTSSHISIVFRPARIRNYVIGAATAVVMSFGLAVTAGAELSGMGVPGARFIVAGLTAACLALPGAKAFLALRARRRHDNAGEHLPTRVAAEQARHLLLRIVGICGFLAATFLIVIFFCAGGGAVQKTFLQWDLVQGSFLDVVKALWINVVIAIVAQLLSMVFGLVLAMGRLLPGKSLAPIRSLAIAYIDLFRGLPAVIVIYLICFGLPITRIPVLSEGSPIVYAVVALTMTFSAYNAELFRSGIEGVNESQVAAALSLGMTRFAVMKLVILPQAFRNITAPLLSLFIALQKDTALVNVVGIIDAFTQAKIFASQHFNLSAISVVCFLFILLTIPQTRLVDALLARSDKRVSRNTVVD